MEYEKLNLENGHILDEEDMAHIEDGIYINSIMIENKQKMLGAITVVLDKDDWIDNQQTLSIGGITSTSIIWVSPAITTTDEYISSNIRAVYQDTDMLMFACDETPEIDISVNVVVG